MPHKRTLVVDAVHEGDALDRTLRRTLQAEPRSTEVVVVAYRSLGLAPAVARRVRLVRERTPAGATARIAALVAAGATVVGAHRPAPTVSISACLIVKDEEAVLPACLGAVATFVDEVVVYDTGSTDRTVDLARAAGARVVEGYWDDHFGDARNRALDHCTGDWVLVVDADEVVTGDPAQLRESLRTAASQVDVAVVTVVSTSWSRGEAGTESRSQRLIRRGRVRWSGRLHEQLVTAASGEEPVVADSATPVRLMHSGYHQEVVSEKDKGARNLRLARLELDATTPGSSGHSKALSNVGRTLFVAGHPDEAVAVLEELKTVTGWPRLLLSAGRMCTTALISSSRLDEARAWVDVLAANEESHGNLEVARARVALAAGEVTEAERSLSSALTPPRDARTVDAWGIAFDAASVVGVRVELASARGDDTEAVALLRDQIQEDPERVDPEQLGVVMDRAGTAWEEVLRGAPEGFLDRLVRVAMTMQLTTALRWCEAFVAARPQDPRPVVAGCIVASRCDLETVLTWSVKAREAGLPELCPLRHRAEQAEQASADRALLWALLADSFGEEEALGGFHATVAAMPDEDVPRLTSAMAELTPDLAHALFGAPGAS